MEEEESGSLAPADAIENLLRISTSGIVGSLEQLAENEKYASRHEYLLNRLTRRNFTPGQIVFFMHLLPDVNKSMFKMKHFQSYIQKSIGLLRHQEFFSTMLETQWSLLQTNTKASFALQMMQRFDDFSKKHKFDWGAISKDDMKGMALLDFSSNDLHDFIRMDHMQHNDDVDDINIQMIYHAFVAGLADKSRVATMFNKPDVAAFLICFFMFSDSNFFELTTIDNAKVIESRSTVERDLETVFDNMVNYVNVLLSTLLNVELSNEQISLLQPRIEIWRHPEDDTDYDRDFETSIDKLPPVVFIRFSTNWLSVKYRVGLVLDHQHSLLERIFGVFDSSSVYERKVVETASGSKVFFVFDNHPHNRLPNRFAALLPNLVNMKCSSYNSRETPLFISGKPGRAEFCRSRPVIPLTANISPCRSFEEWMEQTTVSVEELLELVSGNAQWKAIMRAKDLSDEPWISVLHWISKTQPSAKTLLERLDRLFSGVMMNVPHFDTEPTLNWLENNWMNLIEKSVYLTLNLVRPNLDTVSADDKPRAAEIVHDALGTEFDKFNTHFQPADHDEDTDEQNVVDAWKNNECFDLLDFEDVDVDKFLETAGEDGVVVRDGRKLNCLKRSYFANWATDRDNVRHPCARKDPNKTSRRPIPAMYVNLPLAPSHTIPYADLDNVLGRSSKDDRIFALKRTDQQFEAMASNQAAYSSNPDWVSALHCQAGSGERVSRLVKSRRIPRSKQKKQNTPSVPIKSDKVEQQSRTF